MSRFKDPNKFAFGKQLKKAIPLTKDMLYKLGGKPFYDKYKVGDKILYFMLETHNGSINGMTQIICSMEPIVERTLDRLNKEYTLIRMAGNNEYPVFKKKD